MPFKNHVQSKGKSLKAEQKKFFDADILSAYNTVLDGSQTSESRIAAAKKLGQKDFESKIYLNNREKLNEVLTNYMDAETAFNEDQANFLKKAGQQGMQIRKAVSSTELANQKLKHDKQLEALQHHNAKTTENLSYNFALAQVRLDNQIQTAFLMTDALARLQTSAMKPQLRQIESDRTHTEQLINQHLKLGNDSEERFLPHKDYKVATLEARATTALTALTSKLGLLL